MFLLDERVSRVVFDERRFSIGSFAGRDYAVSALSVTPGDQAENYPLLRR
jgi:hypothetical protein